MIAHWFWTSWTDAGRIALSAVLMMVAVISIIRLVGLRSLSKMSSFDFAVTVAIGSITASTVASTVPVASGALAVAALLAVQAAISWLRRRVSFGVVVDNTPTLLMRDGTMIDAALTLCRVTESDVVAKLREANVDDLSRVHAVVLETTGDISVLHGDGPIDTRLLRDVRDLR